MNITKTLTLKWWQVSIFKITCAAFGIMIGAYWSDWFLPYLLPLLLVTLAGGCYITIVWWRE
jgi:hypothetical protein